MTPWHDLIWDDLQRFIVKDYEALSLEKKVWLGVLLEECLASDTPDERRAFLREKIYAELSDKTGKEPRP